MKRALVLVLPLLALGLVACGDDDDAPDVTSGATGPDVTTDGSSPDLTLPDLSIPDLSIPDISLPDNLTLPDNITIPDFSIPDLSIPDLSIPENGADLLAQMFPKLDDEQIDCLLDAAGDITGSTADQSAVLDYLDQCNVEAADLVPG
ncbi:MAG: hypothetical protein ABW195_17110 [Ilumatobacteraceae bacterium]